MLQVCLRDHPEPYSPLFKAYGSSPTPHLTSTCRDKQVIMLDSASQRPDDQCRYWELWTHPEDIESDIVCFTWIDRHRLRPMIIAAALAFLRPEVYRGIKADDVIKVYYYLYTHQNIPENAFADWQMMREMRMHPSWRYHVIWASSCNIRRIQDLLDQSLLAVYKEH
ncbi:hypothetical protein BDR22DRAFT_822864 [Usnea florida]